MSAPPSWDEYLDVLEGCLEDLGRLLASGGAPLRVIPPPARPAGTPPGSCAPRCRRVAAELQAAIVEVESRRAELSGRLRALRSRQAAGAGRSGGGLSVTL